jgi:hypothetical protein
MPLWHLLPLDSTSDHWRSSTYKGEVIVRAASEAEARSTATATFFTAYARTPGDTMLFSPWGQASIVGCQRVAGVYPMKIKAPQRLYIPSLRAREPYERARTRGGRESIAAAPLIRTWACGFLSGVWP